MKFNDNSKLAGRHAFLSASKSAWVNYDDDKIERVFLSNMAAQRGTDLHDLASTMIRLGVKLPENGTTLSLYVNDCIGFRMTPELTLYYSPNAFGTADAVSFRKNLLRIFDLKTGLGHTTIRQLEVYAAYFCLEYGFKPHEIGIELRIYQNDEARIYDADPNSVAHIMDRIVHFDKEIARIREEAE